MVNFTSEQHSVSLEKRRGTPHGTQWFRGPDNMDYHWRCITHFWRNEMKVRLLLLQVNSFTYQAFFPQCLDTKGDVVATYRATTMALSKDGELRIYPVWNRSHSPSSKLHTHYSSRVKL